MPVIVRLLADARWLPWPEALRDGQWPSTTPPDMDKQFRATKLLIEDELPRIIAAVMTSVDGYPVDESEVQVQVSHFHPWGHNTTDLSVSVHAGIGRHRLTDDLHRARQTQVIELLSEGLLEFFRDVGVMPNFDLECENLTSSGIARYNDVIVSEWGTPSAVNR